MQSPPGTAASDQVGISIAAGSAVPPSHLRAVVVPSSRSRIRRIGNRERHNSQPTLFAFDVR
jgi:hypothetical protein